MKFRSRMLVALLLVCLLLCAIPFPAQAQDTYHPQLTETVLPQSDDATGTLIFYLNGTPVYAGAPVSQLMAVDHTTYDDLSTLVQPWHMSGVIRFRILVPDTAVSKCPFIFFVALNASDDPLPISECLIYSITVNCSDGVCFGSGKESTPFVSGQTTRDELIASYGEPDASVSNSTLYEEIFYYEPFSGVSFSFYLNTVRQISSYYCANIYGGLEDQVDFNLNVGPMELDAAILMSQYLDVTPYLDQTDDAADASQSDDDQEADTTGILSKFNSYFTLDGKQIKFGTAIEDMPQPFRGNLSDLTIPVDRNYYMRIGRNDAEEFFVINNEGQKKMLSNTLSIKGVVTESNRYCNWGTDNSAFLSFNCQGITEESTIDDIVELFGAPKELFFSSGERTCFAWMHYETADGDKLHLRVDPMLNQVIEVHMSKHFDKETSY